MALRQRQGGGDSERLTQAEPARQMPLPSQFIQPGAQRQSSPAEDSRQAQELSRNLDRVGQSVSSQAERADSQLPLTQKATEQKSRAAEESARQLGADHPAESAEILKSAELAKEEFGEALKARSAGDEKKAEAHEEKAREHFDAASEKADAIAKLDSAIKELKEAGAPPELLGAMKLPSFKASAAKELSDYAKSASRDLRSATAADKAAMGPIYARGLLALKAGKRVEAGLHSELAKAYPKASGPDKGKIGDASSASAKGRMSAADVLALMSAIRTGPGGAGIPPGKIRERIMAIQARLRELSSRPGLAAKLKGISALIGPALAYAAKAEEARRVGDDAKAANFDKIASNHLLEAEAKLKALETPEAPSPEASPKAIPGAGTAAPAAAKAMPTGLMDLLKAEFAGREAALGSWLTAAGGDPDEIMSVLKDVYSMRIEGAIKETKDPGRIAGAMTILASLEKPTVKDLEAARAYLSPIRTSTAEAGPPKPEDSKPAAGAPPRPTESRGLSGSDALSGTAYPGGPAGIPRGAEEPGAAIADARISLALSDARAKAAAIDEPGSAAKYAKALGAEGSGEYERMKSDVSRALAFAEEGAALLRDSASLPGTEKEALAARGMLLIGLSGRILDASAAKRDSILNVRGVRGRAELDLAHGIYADVAERAAHGSASVGDLKMIAEADSSLKAGVAKLAEEKLEKLARAERGEIKKLEKRLGELRGRWGGTFGFDKAETGIREAERHLGKGDLMKARRARMAAAVRLELHSERAEVFDAHKKLGAGASDDERKSGLSRFKSSETLAGIDDAIAKADRGDLKGALKGLAAARSKRISESAEQILENIITEKMGVASTLDALERFCRGESTEEPAPVRIMKSIKTGKEVKMPGKSKAYTDALRLVLDPLATSLRDKKDEIKKDADEVAKKRDRLRTETGADLDGIEPVVSKHKESMKNYSDYLKGAGFAIDMGTRGAHYLDSAGKMDERGIYDDILASSAAEYLRLGAAAAASPGTIAKALDEGKPIPLPELRHTVKGDPHTPDRVIAVSPSAMKPDEALKRATAGVLGVGEGKSLGKWDTDLSRAAAEADTRLTIATAFGLGKDGKGDYKTLFMTHAEKEFIGKLSVAGKTAAGWFFEFTSMGSPLSYDERVAGLTASGDLARAIEKKAAPLITEIAERGASELPDWKTESIKAKTEDEAVKLDASAAAASAKVIASVASATEDEVISGVAVGVAEFLAANAATFVTGGLAGPLYYSFKSAAAIGEADLSGAYDEMDWDEKAWLWAGFGFSAFGALSSAAGGALSGARGVAALERTLEIAGKAGTGADIALNMKALNDAIGSGASGYEIGLIIFSSAAPRAISAMPSTRPGSGAPDLGPGLARRAASVALSGGLPAEASPPVPEASVKGDEPAKSLAGIPEVPSPSVTGVGSAAEKAKAIIASMEKRYGLAGEIPPPGGGPPGGHGGLPPAPPPRGPSVKDAGSRHEEFAAGVLSKYELENPEKLREFVGKLIKKDPEALRVMEEFSGLPEIKVVGEMFAEAREKRLFKTAPDRFIKGDLLRIADKYAPKIRVDAAKSPEAKGASPHDDIAPATVPGPTEGSLRKRTESIYRKRDAGETLSAEEAGIVAGVEALVAKGMRRDAAIAYFEDSSLRPHKVPLSSELPSAFKGAEPDVFGLDVTIYDEGAASKAPFESAPRAKLLEAVDLDATGREMGASARVYHAEIMVDGEPKEVAVKLFKDGSRKKFDEMRAEYEALERFSADPALADHVPKGYGIVNVDGNFGYAMDIIPGGKRKDVELGLISAGEVKTHITKDKLAKLKDALEAFVAAGYNPGDLQFSILTDKVMLNGKERDAGHIILLDMPAKSDVSKLGGSFIEERFANIECRVDRIVLEDHIARTPSPELDEVARGAMSIHIKKATGARVSPSAVPDPLVSFLKLGREKRAELAKEYVGEIAAISAIAGKDLEAALKKIETDTGVPLLK